MEEEGARIFYFLQARIAHREDADFIGRAEAVFHATQDAVILPAIALEIEHGIDHMLEHARPGDLSILGDMANEDEGKPALFGRADEFMRAGAHLGDGAGGGIERIDEHGLDGIDDDDVRCLATIDTRQNFAHRGGGGELQRCIAEAQTLTAQLNLRERFLARDVEDGVSAARQYRRRLQQQGGFPDAGVAAKQNSRTFDEAAAQHAVKLGDAGGFARMGGDGFGEA